ncbi:porin [Shimwellia pseudoproteus]|uniref:YfaZ family outer membrane protein n=1 Tax=Shimwellia pseudoproteus TaxID=570012 RepID=UPI0018ECC506|nr:YfaZ family outer membrane protein [Shimwellia pseudoproteus]MBJ3816758.1 porin [Shimwellia pseudoproteus]
MTRFKIIALTGLLVASGQALAIGGSIEQGKNFTNLNVDMGKSTGGIYLESNWTWDTDDGGKYGGVGAGYNFDLGPVMLNAGAKAVYLNPKKGDDGMAFPVGGGFKIDLPMDFAIYGEGYVAPDSMTNSVKSYTEADGGISWSPISLVTVKAGYRYAGVDGNSGHPKHSIVDGAYLGAGVTF